MDRVIVADQLTKRFGQVAAVDRVSLHADRGETVVLWGPNGAGKSTLLRCLLGVISFDGTVWIGGIDVRANGKAARAQVGYVPQDVRLPDHQSVLETVLFYAELRGVAPAAALAQLEVWELDGARAKRVHELSGGMRQRLAVALALMADPPILLLDEPTSNLDLRAQRAFVGTLERLKAAGKTLVVCSHHASDAWRIANRLVVLEQGRIVAHGPPERVLRELGEESLLGVTVDAEHQARAAGLLRQQGFVVCGNGDGRRLWVRVAAGRKIEPVRLLAEARIPVLDIDLNSLLPTGQIDAGSPS